MLRKFIVVCIIFIALTIIINMVRFFTVYDGDILKLKNRMEMLETIVDVSALAMVDLSGKKYTIAETNGKPRILMFWATWCKYCRREMPELNAFLSQNAGEGIVVIPITVPTDTVSGITRYFSQLGVSNMRTYIDPVGDIFRTLRVPGIPYYVVVDSTGKAVATIRPVWNQDLKRLLSKVQ